MFSAESQKKLLSLEFPWKITFIASFFSNELFEFDASTHHLFEFFELCAFNKPIHYLLWLQQGQIAWADE